MYGLWRLGQRNSLGPKNGYNEYQCLMSIHHHAVHHRHHHPPAIQMLQVGEERPVPFSLKLDQEYERMYTTQIIRDTKVQDLAEVVKKILAGKARYEIVSAKTHVP